MRCPIIKTIAYFDIFDWPLRAEEIWKWLFASKCSPKTNEIINALKNKNLIGTVLKEENGFYFLFNKKNLVKTRLIRYKFAERKYRRAILFIKLISLLPFIKTAAICNDLGYSNAADSSDIDLFIITSQKRIWTARFFITGFLKLFRLRPGETKKDALCPSFFIDEGNLNLEKLTLKDENGKTDDPHFTVWINQMTPILNKDRSYEKFRQENSWVKKFLPNIYDYKLSSRRKQRHIPRTMKFEKIFGNWFENLAKKIQLKIMPSELKNNANINTNVVITDGVLKFHQDDTREEIRNKFYSKLRNYENGEITKNN